MEDKFQLRASLGSKLPKFGTSKPVASFLQRAQNGSCNGISAKGNVSVEKHIEHDRTSALPLNWSKSRYPQNDQISRAPPNFAIEKTCQVMVQNDAHRPGVPKPGKQSNMLVSPEEDLSDHVLSSSTKFIKGTQFGRTSYPGSSGHKPLSNGFYTAKPPTGLYRPRANSATGRNFTTNVFTYDNKPFSHVRRSQSFSHSIQNSKYPATGLTRSYSLHRETDMTKIHQLQHLPTRTDLQSRTAKLYGLSNGNEPHIKSMFTRTGYSTSLTSGLKKPVFTNGPVASAPLGYKLTRPSLQKANRPPYPREIIADGTKGSSVAPVNHKIELVSNGTCQATGPLHKGEEEDLDIDHFSSCKNLERQDFRDSYFSEDVDELSISSLSSSDKNDFSEDFSDDFLDLEDVNKTIIVEKPEKTFPEKPSQHLLSEPDEKQNISNNIDDWLDMNMSDLEDGNKTLSDEKLDKTLPEEPLYSLGDLHARNKRNSNNSDDWIDMNLSVKNEADTKSHSYVENGISPDMEYRDPSSLELSPSDSSDGTYMWDEEGMEPIGNVHRCESYESSEMNSLDILNNIETCDLEEDDLMLDVEIPEDPPCDPGEVENMSRFERSDRNLRQQKLFWKRNPRLNGQEQYHLSNPEQYHNGRGSSCLESPPDQKDSYGSPYCSPLSPRSPQAIVLQENTVMLDEMTLRHMVQDCTTVKTQLLKLKRLLQQADDLESPVQDLQLCIPTTIEQTETETNLKPENLLTEIQQLREESRKKDDMIKQLQEQLKTRCKCQIESQEPKVEKLKQHDKFTQTSRRRNSPQILQYSSSTLSSTDHPSGKLTIRQVTGVPNESAEQIQQSLSFYQSEDSGASSITPASELSDLLSSQLKINDGEGNPKNRKEKHDKRHAQCDKIKNVRLCSYNLVPQSLPSQQKDVKSKTSVNASLPGRISGPKTLRCPKPKLQYTLAHRGNTLAPPNSSSTSTDFNILMNSSGPSLQQENFHTKKKPTIPNTTGLQQTTVNVSPDSNTCKLEKICSPAGQSLLTKSMPDARHLIRSTSPSSDKLSSEGELPTHLRAPATEPSKPVRKLMPKGSLLRPTSNLPSKLKAPNISKPDMHSKDVPKESQKPLGKASSVVPRHLSHKKDGMREADTCSSPKRQSRLPQPKSH